MLRRVTPSLLALGLMPLAPVSAQAEGARAAAEVGAVLGSTAITRSIDDAKWVQGGVDGEPGWIAGAHIEWPLGTTVHLGGELWFTLLEVRTAPEAPARSHTYAGLAPRLRLSFPLAGRLSLDGQLALGASYVAQVTRYGSLNLATRAGFGLAHPITERYAGFVGLTHHFAILWPVEAFAEDSRIYVWEPQVVGLTMFMLTVGIRFLE